MSLFINPKYLILFRSLVTRDFQPHGDYSFMSSGIIIKPILHQSTDSTQEGQFSLIHIPLPLYSSLIQPILRVLLPHGGSSPNEPEDFLEGLSIDNKHGFLNISVTPIECSIVCHTSWAKNIFTPVIARLPLESQKQVQISKDTYIVFSVSSAGMEAGQRVMDLTAPLAMAGIPIFFITTYVSNRGAISFHSQLVRS